MEESSAIPYPAENKVVISTPEGVDLELQVAGPLVRAIAFLFDTSFKLVIQLTCYYLLKQLGGSGLGLFMLVIFSLDWLYSVMFEVLWRGKTPGKAIMGIQVIHEDGTPVSWSASMLRNLIRFIDLLPFAYQVGLITMLLTRHFKRLGDLVAGTLVVYNEVQAEAYDLKVVPQANMNPKVPPMPMSPDEQLAIIHFDELSYRISESRACEIANTLSDVVGCKNIAALKELRQIASWFRGAKN